MDQTGLVAKIILSVENIDLGRKGLASDGNEHEGRIFYETGLSSAMESFKEAHSSEEAETLILAEQAYLSQELRFCDPTDISASNSVIQAIASFDDALHSLDVVQDETIYRGVNKTYLHQAKYRIKDMPKDAFHNACLSHKTRLSNMLRVPGINMTEKALCQQRLQNIVVAQRVYLKMQKKILE